YIEPMEFHLPLYAVQRLADDQWLVRSPMGDPILPAVDVFAVVGAPRAAPRPARAARPLASLEQAYGAHAPPFAPPRPQATVKARADSCSGAFWLCVSLQRKAPLSAGLLSHTHFLHGA